MSRFILIALAGVVLLTGCPSVGGDTVKPGISNQPSGDAVKPGTTDQPEDETPAYKTQTSVTLRLSGAVQRVDRVETALFRRDDSAEVAVPGASASIRRDDLPQVVPLADLHGNTTYRFEAQAYDAANQALATSSAEIVVAGSPPATQSLELSILEIPLAGSISHP
ncbi:MAG TPA: hypothetical protein V6D00_07975 [Pantanalinema sp.]